MNLLSIPSFLLIRRHEAALPLLSSDSPSPDVEGSSVEHLSDSF